MIIFDSHMHLFSLDQNTYPRKKVTAALKAQVTASPPEPAMAEDYLRVAGENSIGKALLVASIFYGTDTSYLFHVIQKYPDIFKAVIITDYNDNGGQDILQEQIVNDYVAGARLHLFNDNRANAVLEMDSDIQKTIQIITDSRKVVDLHIKSDQMDVVYNLASDFKDTTFVIDHMGRPSPRHRVNQTYERQIERLASLPNVYVKLSGYELGSEMGYPFDDMILYANYLLRALGIDRCMWGSDYPYINNTSDLAGALHIAKALVEGKSETERQQFLFGTAQDVFWGV